MASMTSPDEAHISMDSPAGAIEAVVGSFLNLPSVPALTQPTEAKAASAEPNTSAGDANSDECESSDDGDDSEDGDDEAGNQMDLMLAMMRLLQKQMPKKKKTVCSKSKSKSKAIESATPLLNGRGSSMDQEQLLTVLSKALSTMDSPDDEPATSTPKQKRAKLSADNKKPAGPRQMPQLARPCADSAAPAQQKGNVGGCGAEGGEDTILHCFMDQLPQIDGHLDAMIAAADAAVDPQEAQPSPTEHVSSSAGASARGCSAQQNNARDDGAGSGSRFPPPNTPHFSAHERQTGSWDAVSSSSMDSSAAAAAAAAAAALAVNSRKRKSGEDGGAYAGNGGNGEQAAISSRSASEARWNGNGQMQECRPLSLPHPTSNGPVVVSRQQMQQSACKPPLLSLPAACLATPGSAPLLRAPVSNASAASAPPPPATPLRMLTVPADVSPNAAPMARPNVMDRFGGVGEDLSADQPLGFPVRFGGKRMDDCYTDGTGNHASGNGGYNDSGNGCDDGGMGYDDMGGDDMDDWMPRSRGRKDRQVVGGRIKARSMAERQRRERISEGLQKLRMAVRGHGDTATMLDNAVAYVQALQRRVTSLETNMLLHQASCGGLGQAGGALGGGNGSNSNNRGRHANGFINPSQFGSLFGLDLLLSPRFPFPRSPAHRRATRCRANEPFVAHPLVPRLPSSRLLAAPPVVTPPVVSGSLRSSRLRSPRRPSARLVAPPLASPRLRSPRRACARLRAPPLASSRFLSPRRASARLVALPLASPRLHSPRRASARLAAPPCHQRANTLVALPLLAAPPLPLSFSHLSSLAVGSLPFHSLLLPSPYFSLCFPSFPPLLPFPCFQSFLHLLPLIYSPASSRFPLCFSSFPPLLSSFPPLFSSFPPLLSSFSLCFPSFPPPLPLISPAPSPHFFPCFPSFPFLLLLISLPASPRFPPCFPSFPPLILLISLLDSPHFPPCISSFPFMLLLISLPASPRFPPCFPSFPPLIPLISLLDSPHFPPCFSSVPPLIPLISLPASPHFPPCFPSFPPLILLISLPASPHFPP
ncbi:unnamed protein product [Closterium sp. Naga37s-1]|nr:unnamed protein product [Closterium sp. Naga37s-1]